jgi:hypothetical protein
MVRSNCLPTATNGINTFSPNPYETARTEAKSTADLRRERQGAGMLTTSKNPTTTTPAHRRDYAQMSQQQQQQQQRSNHENSIIMIADSDMMSCSDDDGDDDDEYAGRKLRGRRAKQADHAVIVMDRAHAATTTTVASRRRKRRRRSIRIRKRQAEHAHTVIDLTIVNVIDLNLDQDGVVIDLTQDQDDQDSDEFDDIDEVVNLVNNHKHDSSNNSDDDNNMTNNNNDDDESEHREDGLHPDLGDDEMGNGRSSNNNSIQDGHLTGLVMGITDSTTVDAVPFTGVEDVRVAGNVQATPVAFDSVNDAMAAPLATSVNEQRQSANPENLRTTTATTTTTAKPDDNNLLRRFRFRRGRGGPQEPCYPCAKPPLQDTVGSSPCKSQAKQPLLATADALTAPCRTSCPRQQQQAQTQQKNSAKQGKTKRIRNRIDERRQFWSSVRVSNGPEQCDLHGAGCVAQVNLPKGTKFIDLLCKYKTGDPPEVKGGDATTSNKVLAVRGDYIKTPAGYFDIIPSITEWLNEARGDSKEPNLSFVLGYRQDVKVLVWNVLRPIAKGEELLVDYHGTKDEIDLTNISDDEDADDNGDDDDSKSIEDLHDIPPLIPKLEDEAYVGVVARSNPDFLELDHRRFFMTSIALVSSRCQSDPKGAGIVAQRLLYPGEIFHDYLCTFHCGSLPRECKVKTAIMNQQRNNYIETSDGYFVLDSCWSEWINEAKNPGQTANMIFRVGWEDASPSSQTSSLTSQSRKPILQWWVTQPIAKGKELLVASYGDPILMKNGEYATYFGE